MEQFKDTQGEDEGLILGGEIVELMSGQIDGARVILWCDKENDISFVTVDDPENNDSHVLEVERGENPMEVFNYPLAYVEQRAKQEASQNGQ